MPTQESAAAFICCFPPTRQALPVREMHSWSLEMKVEGFRLSFLFFPGDHTVAARTAFGWTSPCMSGCRERDKMGSEAGHEKINQ